MNAARPNIAARDIMIKRLITLRPHMEALDAIKLLLKHRISGAPVVDMNGRYIGVFSEKCSISVLLASTYDSTPSSEIRAFVDTDARTIDEDTDLLTIMHLFLNTSYRRLPVLNANGDLVGQVSRRDVLKAMHNMHTQTDKEDSGILYLSSLFERAESPIS